VSVKHGRITVGAGAVLVGILYAVFAFRYEMGTLERPGPGLLPRAVAVAIVLMGVVTVLEAVGGRSASVDEDVPEGTGRLLPFVGLLVGYVVVFFFFGFLGASLVALPILTRLLQEEANWPRALIVGVVTAFAVYGLFTKVFEVQLPEFERPLAMTQPGTADG
jgi:putative tricarboxylic transport membrane protein